MKPVAAVLESVDWLQKSRNEREFIERSMVVASICFPSAVIAYHHVGGSRGQCQRHFCADARASSRVQSAWRLHALESPVVRYYRRGGTDPVVLTQELVPERTFRSTALFNECWRPFGVTHQAGLRLWSCNHVAGLSIKRDARFGNDDGRLLRALHPHFLNAWKRISTADGRAISGPSGSVSRLSVCESLTPREREVLGWIAEGKRNSEIAFILGTRPTTVKNQVESILSKLGAENRGVAAAMLRSGATH